MILINRKLWNQTGRKKELKSVNSKSPKVNKEDIVRLLHFFFFSEMKTIALYVAVGFSGIIFVFADEQGDAGCKYRAYVQYLPTYVAVLPLFIYNYRC